MRYLSIDVGSKNMVFCRVETTCTPTLFKITHWFFLDCHGKTVTEIVAKFAKQIKSVDSSAFQCDRVLIESQTARNVKMKVLSHCLQSFFISSCGIEDVQFCSPHNKLKLCDAVTKTSGKPNYRQNKQVAIRKCSELMEEYRHTESDGENFYSFFRDSSKKDDLADSLLQVLFYIL
jgi:hypothetical protein